MYTKFKNKIYSALKKERMGLSLIACALLVVAAISVLMIFYLAKLQEDDSRSQGRSLTRLAAEIPYDQLSSVKTRNTLKNIFYSTGQSKLAYIVLADKTGLIVSEVASVGIVAPPFAISTAPTQWTGERNITIGNNRIMEFYAPILTSAEVSGYVRVGYFKPGMDSILEYMPYIATIILPVFLLTPLFYGLMRREVKPLQSAQARIAEKLDGIQATPVQLSADGSLAEFIDNFNHYIVQNKHKIECLEAEKQQSDVSVRVLSYNFARFEKILDVLPEAIIALDESGAPVCANSRVKTYLNLDVAQVLNEPVHTWAVDDAVKEFFQRCQKNGKSIQQPVKINVNDGVASSLTAQSTPVYHKGPHGSEFGGSIIIIKDDSDIDRAQAGKEQFISHVSHELKTPLNTLAMYSEAMLGSEGQDEEFRTEAINVIHDEVERMSDLINNLLSITQLETGGMKLERHHVKTDDFLRDIFETMSKSDVGKGYKFELDMPNMVSSVAIDKELMRIAINNILTNAIKYNKPGGRVSMRVVESDASIQIAISDTGIGISDEDREKIFEKFYRSDSEDVRQRSGHGLGLALTKDIVNLHNGRLTVTSVPGEGTEFTVEFQKESNLLKWAS